MGEHLLESSKGAEHAQSCRSSTEGGRAGAAGSGDAAEGPLTHPAAAWKEAGAAIWREDLVCRLSNMEGANLGRRLAEQGGICTRQQGSAGTTLCSPLPDPAAPRSLSHPGHISSPSTPLLPPQLGRGCFSLLAKTQQVNSDQQLKLQMPPQWIFTQHCFSVQCPGNAPGSGIRNEQMGRWGVTALPPHMGKLRHRDAGRGPLSKKGLGTQRAAEFTSAKALAHPCPGQECLLAGCQRDWLTPVLLESFSLAG